MNERVVLIPIQGRGPANILDSDAMVRLEAALLAAERAGARAAVLHGPDGRFAAGADLSTLEFLSGPDAHRFGLEGARLFRCMAQSALWLTAAVDGHCIGGGFDIALACDVILASDRATFRHPGAHFGFPTTYGGNRRLPQRVGGAAARNLLLRGMELDAQDALNLGLVWKVLPAVELLGEAEAQMNRWASSTTPESARTARALFRSLPGTSLPASLALERSILAVAAANC